MVQHGLKRSRTSSSRPGRPTSTSVYRWTKVLLVPSIWPEAFGLVATEQRLEVFPYSRRTLAARGGEPRGTTATSEAWFYDHANLNCCDATSTTRWSGPRPTHRRTSSCAHVGRAAERAAAHLFHCLLHVAPKDVADAFVETLTRLKSRRTTRSTPTPRGTRARARWRSSSGTTGRRELGRGSTVKRPLLVMCHDHVRHYVPSASK